MSLSKKQWIAVGVIAIGIVLVLVTNAASGDHPVLTILGCFVIVAGLLLHVKLVRCPHCGEWVGKYPGEYCKQCGKELSRDET